MSAPAGSMWRVRFSFLLFDSKHFQIFCMDTKDVRIPPHPLEALHGSHVLRARLWCGRSSVVLIIMMGCTRGRRPFQHRRLEKYIAFFPCFESFPFVRVILTAQGTGHRAQPLLITIAARDLFYPFQETHLLFSAFKQSTHAELSPN